MMHRFAHSRARTALCWVLAAALLAGLLHGASMAYAESAQTQHPSVSALAVAAVHHPIDHGDHAHPGPHDPGARPAMAGCPHADLVAVLSLSPPPVVDGEGIKLTPERQWPPAAADLGPVDPPPRNRS